MDWKFWKKRTIGEEARSEKPAKLPKPTDIPELVGREMITRFGKDPDWAWKLKGVVRRRQEGKDAYDVRVFDASDVAAKKVTINDYTSLDEYPDLILFEGWFDKKSMEVHIEEKGRSFIGY